MDGELVVNNMNYDNHVNYSFQPYTDNQGIM